MSEINLPAEEMSDDEFDQQYRELIDTFIDQANELAKNTNPENIGLALLNAASRYNAFVVSTHADNLEDFEKDCDKARAFFMSQYESMLQENLDDYKSSYEELRYGHLIKQTSH